jgi:negative regulator of sigma E activity
MKHAMRSGTAQPASTPSSQCNNGPRQRAGARSDRSAIAWNAKSIGKGFRSTSSKRRMRKVMHEDEPSISDQKQIAMIADWNS